MDFYRQLTGQTGVHVSLKVKELAKKDLTVVKQEWAPFEVWGLDELIPKCSLWIQQRQGWKIKMLPYVSWDYFYIMLSTLTCPFMLGWPTTNIWMKWDGVSKHQRTLHRRHAAHAHEKIFLKILLLPLNLPGICLVLYLSVLTCLFQPHPNPQGLCIILWITSAVLVGMPPNTIWVVSVAVITQEVPLCCYLNLLWLSVLQIRLIFYLINQKHNPVSFIPTARVTVEWNTSGIKGSSYRLKYHRNAIICLY